MNARGRASSVHSLAPTFVTAAFYFLVPGIALAALAAGPSFRAWRLASWALSVLAFAAHVGYEHVRLRGTPKHIAWHAALAVAIGAFALAAYIGLRAVSAGSAGARFGLALVLFPLLTAVPAFFVGWVLAASLARLRPPVG